MQVCNSTEMPLLLAADKRHTSLSEDPWPHAVFLSWVRRARMGMGDPGCDCRRRRRRRPPHT